MDVIPECLIQYTLSYININKLLKYMTISKLFLNTSLKFTSVNNFPNFGPGEYVKSIPKLSKGNKISLKRIATSKSKEFMGPIAVSAAKVGDLQSSSKEFLVFKF